jgi:equilibrative nucleoside transporter 1/2/3
MCNYRPATRTLPVWITSDYAFMLAVVVLGVSNGHESSLAMMYAPQ